MIMNEETFEEYGYMPNNLTHGSGKPIFASCDDCGKIRVLLRCCYRPLCKLCSTKGRKLTEKKKAKMSAAMKGKYIGENSSQWKGGISFDPYCVNFNDEYKRKNRTRFGNVCFLCGMLEADNKQKLSVHHVNYNKDCGCDNTKCVCVPLCIQCHAKIGVDRDYWQALIMEMLKPLEAWSN